MDIEANKAFYSFTELDNKLLKETEIFLNELQENAQSIPIPLEVKEVFENEFLPWSEWFALFREAAKSVNPEVVEIIPLQGPSIFKAWYRMKTDPIETGKKYGATAT